MKVVLHHPAFLPPRDYGGIERVVLWLAKGLLELGHEVWVAAYPGSQLPKGIHLIETDREASSPLDLLKRLPKGVDLVHFMAPPSEQVLGQLGVAALATVHGNGREGEIYPRNSVFLSRNHAERHSGEVFVYNGIDPNEYRFSETKGDHFLFLSKTSWRVKNLSGAVKIARCAGIQLRIAGGSRPWALRLLTSFSPSMTWIGPIGGETKVSQLAEAKGLLFPIVWPEPFGLVVVEALMSGTPVVAYRRGSLPELLNSEVGGLIAPEVPYHSSLWKQEIQRVRGLSPAVCREWAIRRFHYRRMAEDYVEQYRRVLSGAYLHPRNPIASDWRLQ